MTHHYLVDQEELYGCIPISWWSWNSSDIGLLPLKKRRIITFLLVFIGWFSASSALNTHNVHYTCQAVIDYIAFELFAIQCGIGRGIRQKKIPQEKWWCRKHNKPIVSPESPHQPEYIWFFLNAISSIRIPWCGLVSKINDMWIRSQGFKPLSFVCIYISHLVTRNVILIYLWYFLRSSLQTYVRYL